MTKSKNTLKRLFCLSGIFGLLFYLLHDIIGGLHYPGYNRLSQAVSDLTAVGAPSYVIAGGLSTIYALFSCLCCAVMCLVVYENTIGTRALRLGVYLFAAMSWVSGIGYALFPLSEAGYAGTFQDIMHTYVVTFSIVFLSITSLVLIIVGGLKSRPIAKGLPLIAAIALACMFIGAIGVGTVPPAYFGLVERFSAYSAVTFTAVLGLYGLRFLKTPQ